MRKIHLLKCTRLWMSAALMASVLVAGCGNSESKYASYDTGFSDYAMGVNGSYDEKEMYSETADGYFSADMSMMGLSNGVASESMNTAGTTIGNQEQGDGNVVPGNGDAKVVLSQEKMIYRANVSAETLNFDESYGQLKNLLNQYGCIIANEEITNDGNSYLYSGYKNSRNGYTTERQAFIEIRVPSGNYGQLLENVEALGNVTSKNSNATNITRSYYDTQAELKSYQEEYAQLEKLLGNATEMSDILDITNQMTMVRSTINRLTSSLQSMDLDVAYSYIYLTLTEVVEYTVPEVKKPTLTFWDRFVQNFEETYTGFFDFLEWLLFFIIRIIPYVVLFGGIYLVYRKTPLYRKNKERKEAKKLHKEEKKLAKESKNNE